MERVINRLDGVYLTPEQAASVIGVAKGTLSNWRLAKEGPRYVKLAKKIVLYHVTDIEKWLKTREAQEMDSRHRTKSRISREH